MQRYNQKYIGIGPMIKSDNGVWVKDVEVTETIKHNADIMFKVIEERNIEIKDLQSELQHTFDDLEDSRRRGFKLFTLLVISSALNFITVAVVTLTMMGKI
jgi:hypothetical protein